MGQMKVPTYFFKPYLKMFEKMLSQVTIDNTSSTIFVSHYTHLPFFFPSFFTSDVYALPLSST
jgi:hypothetical protein